MAAVASPADPDEFPTAWITDHLRAWEMKPGLRAYYRQELFDRLAGHLRSGLTLELGSGPGFFAAHRPGMVCTDLTWAPHLSACADAHALPFADASFDNVAGIDVLHHLASPSQALGETARVLRPGGRVVLIEPWTGALGRLVYRHLHHEACEPVAEPWQEALPAGASPMDGNAMIPKTLLVDRAAELSRQVPNLSIVKVAPFGIASYALTGGFQGWGAPPGMIRLLIGLEALIPRLFLASLALRALFVLDRRADP